jgi:hypothetical protein
VPTHPKLKQKEFAELRSARSRSGDGVLMGVESFGRYEAANLPHRVIDLHVECALPQLRR